MPSVDVTGVTPDGRRSLGTLAVMVGVDERTRTVDPFGLAALVGSDKET